MRCLSVCAFEIFHDDEGFAVFFADVVDGADVGMIERGGGFGFALKRSRACASWATSSGRNFSATTRSQARVFGFVNDAHAAAAEFFDDAVVRDGLANHWCSSVIGEAC